MLFSDWLKDESGNPSIDCFFIFDGPETFMKSTFKLLFLAFEESGALVSVPTLCLDISGTSYESNLTIATFSSS